MPPRAPRTLWDRASTAVRNDPQKAGILVVLVGILVVLQVRLYMSGDREGGGGGGGPSRAVAGTSVGPAHHHGSSGGAGAVAHSAADPAAALRAWMEAPPAPLTRNLFAIDLQRFPRGVGAQQQQAATGKPAVGFWDELAKSMAVRADVRRERQVLVENLARQAGQLRLQSTIMGASPKAVIDGELVGEGDVVASFRVLKIEPRRIIVEREGIKLEIQMK